MTNFDVLRLIDELDIMRYINEEDREEIIKTVKEISEFLDVKEIILSDLDFSPAKFLMLSAVVKIYIKSGKTKYDVKKLYRELNEFFIKNKSKIIEVSVNGVDGESEYLTMFTDNYNDDIN